MKNASLYLESLDPLMRCCNLLLWSKHSSESRVNKFKSQGSLLHKFSLCNLLENAVVWCSMSRGGDLTSHLNSPFLTECLLCIHSRHCICGCLFVSVDEKLVEPAKKAVTSKTSLFRVGYSKSHFLPPFFRCFLLYDLWHDLQIFNLGKDCYCMYLATFQRLILLRHSSVTQATGVFPCFSTNSNVMSPIVPKWQPNLNQIQTSKFQFISSWVMPQQLCQYLSRVYG